MKSRVLVVYPWLRILGGAEIVALHLIRWLTDKKGADVTLLTLYPAEQEVLQRMSGIAWNRDRVEVELAPCPRWVLGLKTASILKIAFLHRRAKQISRQYALCISPYGEADYGVKGAQIIHHPTFVSKQFLHRYRMTGNITILDHWNFLGELYRKLCFLVSRNTVEGFKRNVTLPNTEFLRSVVEEAYGVRGDILHPAVLPDVRPRGLAAWEDREFLVVALGRLAPDKNTLHVLELFAALHRRFPEARLVVVGRIADTPYAERVRERAEELSLPVEFATDASNEEVHAYLSRAKFLLHAKEFEHFGIALVEAADFGCLPLAHDSGGTPELLPSPLLRYRTATDLVRNVEQLMGDVQQRKVAQDELIAGLDRFRLAAFESTLDRTLASFFADPADGPR